MDPKIKVEVVENILNFIAIYMNQQFQQEDKVYND